jgi:hypothetical protein
MQGVRVRIKAWKGWKVPDQVSRGSVAGAPPAQPRTIREYMAGLEETDGKGGRRAAIPLDGWPRERDGKRRTTGCEALVHV